MSAEGQGSRRAVRHDGSDAIHHVVLTHASTIGGNRGILRDGFVRPSRLHCQESESFFALGLRQSFNHTQDIYDLARLIDSSWNASKNQSQIIITLLSWGSAQNVDAGGESVCVGLTKEHGILHHRRAKMFVANKKCQFITGVAWLSDAKPPSSLF